MYIRSYGFITGPGSKSWFVSPLASCYYFPERGRRLGIQYYVGNIQDKMDRGAAAKQVRDVIESLDRDGLVLCDDDEWKRRFHTVSITKEEGESLREWVIKENAAHSIEIGLAFGFSALHICEGLLLNCSADLKHVVLDPGQSIGYGDRGLKILDEAGVSALVEFHGEPSQLALPQFLKQGRRFDFAFVDGNHRFDAVFLDLYYLGHLVRRGGVIVVDDYQLPAIKRAASFFVNNLEWRIEETSSRSAEHHWVVLRTAPDDDTRDFRYFVEF